MKAGTHGDTAETSSFGPGGDGRDTPFRGGVPPYPPTRLGAEVRRLARQVGRLSPSWRDPERYFEERDELERALRRIANHIEVERDRHAITAEQDVQASIAEPPALLRQLA